MSSPVFKAHLCHSMYQHASGFYGQVIFHPYLCILLNHSSVDEQLGCFYPGALTNNSAKSIHIHVLMEKYFFNYLGYISRSRNPGSYGDSTLTCWRTAKLVSKVSVPFKSPASTAWGFWLPHKLAKAYYCLSFLITVILVDVGVCLHLSAEVARCSCAHWLLELLWRKVCLKHVLVVFVLFFSNGLNTMSLHSKLHSQPFKKFFSFKF